MRLLSSLSNRIFLASAALTLVCMGSAMYLVNVRVTGKHPPAEPEAFDCEPLKAAISGSLTRPLRTGATGSVAPYRHRFNWSSRLSSASCFVM